MSKYIVNVEPMENEGFTVHTDWCPNIPPPDNQLLLGHFETCWQAIHQAEALDITASACIRCCKECQVAL